LSPLLAPPSGNAAIPSGRVLEPPLNGGGLVGLNYHHAGCYCRSHRTYPVTVRPDRVEFPRTVVSKSTVCHVEIVNRARKDVEVSNECHVFEMAKLIITFKVSK